ncbi:sugar ABC transporter permease [Phytomonospora sp. NPDC050363]|uniref:carbohydrate ABC transporter permease n=1 Tax=Phytomonospora sp. NPDC050363 TaxID=3155642 RepID=UPI0033DED204
MVSTALKAEAGRPGTPDRPRPIRRRPVRGRTLAFWLFVGPFLAGLVFFTFVPIGWSLWLSFFEAQNTVTPTEFVGLRNYTEMLADPEFRRSMLTFTVFAAFIIPVTTALSLALALLVNRVRFMQAFFRSAFFIPAACSYVVACMIWRLSIFNGVRFGLANTLLLHFDLDTVAWLQTTDPPLYWLVLITVRLWLQLGFYMILFLAARQRIPGQLYEAAYLDGASPGWQTFRHVTLPALRATTVAVVLLNLIAAYQAFDEFYNLMGNTAIVRPPLIYLYNTALGAEQDFGRGSAGALILSGLIVIVTLLQGKFLRLGKRED